MDKLAALKIPIRVVKGATAPIDNVAGVWIQSLGRSDDEGDLSHHNASMVLRIRFGENSFLFTGDIGAATEHATLEAHSDLHASVLKVPHHGSATSSCVEFIGAVAPQFAVISTGYMNRFHFPAQDVIDRYESIGATVLRTDLDGAVTADASPTRLVVSTSWGEPMVTAVDNELRPANHGPRPLAQFILAALRVDGF
jgi:competence protein ComEC